MTVITRFAPSPTGHLHTGSARTALFNYLFSRHHKGKYYLRIEDTDRERSTEEATEAIINDLIWLELEWDKWESEGSKDGIVYQSGRANRHKEVAESMIKKGNAYYCYTTSEEIEKFRIENPGAKFQSPWRDKDPKSAPVGAKPVIRLKAPKEGKTIVNDLIQGEITVENTELDDMVMLRSDGTPTYMLAVVVDDHDMGITHIIRGADHLTNSFRQKQIYIAMGWDVPEFGHIPLIMDKDGQKLSKRKGALGIEEYKKRGYLPEAVANHLLRLGWGHGNDEIIDKAQAIDWFDLNGVGKSPARFDIDKLNFINGHYLRQLSNYKLLKLIKPFLQDIHSANEDKILKGMDGLKARAHTLIELADAAKIYISKHTELDERTKEVLANLNQHLFADIVNMLKELEHWNRDRLTASMNEIAARNEVKSAQIMQTLRATVVGSLSGPSIYEVMEILGKDEVLRRVQDSQDSVLQTQTPKTKVGAR